MKLNLIFTIEHAQLDFHCLLRNPISPTNYSILSSLLLSSLIFPRSPVWTHPIMMKHGFQIFWGEKINGRKHSPDEHLSLSFFADLPIPPARVIHRRVPAFLWVGISFQLLSETYLSGRYTPICSSCNWEGEGQIIKLPGHYQPEGTVRITAGCSPS